MWTLQDLSSSALAEYEPHELFRNGIALLFTLVVAQCICVGFYRRMLAQFLLYYNEPRPHKLQKIILTLLVHSVPVASRPYSRA